MKCALKRCLCLLAALSLLCVPGRSAYAETAENKAPPVSSVPLTPEERAALEISLVDSLCVVISKTPNRYDELYVRLENPADYSIRDFRLLNQEGELICYQHELPPHGRLYVWVSSYPLPLSDQDPCCLRYGIGDYYYITGDYPLRVKEESTGVFPELPELQIETDEGPVPLLPGQSADLSGRSINTLKKVTLSAVQCSAPDKRLSEPGAPVSIDLVIQGTDAGSEIRPTVKLLDEKGYIVYSGTVSFMYGGYLTVPMDRGALTLRFED